MRRSSLAVIGLLLAGATPAPAQDPVVDFAAEIWPILESRCIKCHHAPHRLASGRMKRPKGRVRLDSVEAIRASKRGTLIVPGEPGNSLILDLISLPGDHDDRMPPATQGAPLSEVDVARIKQWIAQGARFGSWKSAAKITADSTGVGSGPQPSKTQPPITALVLGYDSLCWGIHPTTTTPHYGPVCNNRRQSIMLALRCCMLRWCSALVSPVEGGYWA